MGLPPWALAYVDRDQVHCPGAELRGLAAA